MESSSETIETTPTIEMSTESLTTMASTTPIDDDTQEDHSDEIEGIEVVLTLDGDYSSTVSIDKEKFLMHIKTQIAAILRVPVRCILKIDSSQGSIVITFTLVPSNDPDFTIGEEALFNAKKELARKVRENEAFLTDWMKTSHKIVSINDDSDDLPQTNNKKKNEKTSNSGLTGNTYLIFGLAIGAIIIMIALIIVTACLVRAYIYRKFHRQIIPAESTVRMYLLFSFNEKLETI
jgi:hypothetical protein